MRTGDCGSPAAKGISTPMRRIRSPCCALATADHVAAAAPPMSVMNSRRLMLTHLRRGSDLTTPSSENRVVRHSKSSGQMSQLGHVWTAPAVQEESDYQRSVRV